MTFQAPNGIDIRWLIVQGRMAELRAEGDASRQFARRDWGRRDRERPPQVLPMIRRRLVPVVTELKAMLETTSAAPSS